MVQSEAAERVRAGRMGLAASLTLHQLRGAAEGARPARVDVAALAVLISCNLDLLCGGGTNHCLPQVRKGEVTRELVVAAACRSPLPRWGGRARYFSSESPGSNPLAFC